MFKECFALSSIGDVIFLHTSLSLADSPNIDEETLNRFGGFANAAGESGVAPLKTLGLPAATLTFNTAAQTYLETEGIIAKLTDDIKTYEGVKAMYTPADFDASTVREITPEEHLSYHAAKEQALQEEIE